MTAATCAVCKREVAVGLQRGVRLGNKWIVWRECVSCFLKDVAERST